MMRVIGAEGKQRMRVLFGRSPGQTRLVAMRKKVGYKSRNARIERIEIEQRQHQEGRFLDGRRRLRIRQQLAGPTAVTDSGKRPRHPRTGQQVQARTVVVETEHPITVGDTRQGQRVASISRLTGTQTVRPAAEELHHIPLRFRRSRKTVLLGLDKEVRGIERDLTVPRRIIDVRPHDEVPLSDHRRHAGNASGDVLRAVRRGGRGLGREDAARGDQREDAGCGLLETAVRIVREPRQRAAEFRQRRVDERSSHTAESGRRTGVPDLAGLQSDDTRRLAPRHGRTHRQLDRLLMDLIKALGAIGDLHLARQFRRRQRPTDHRSLAVRETDRPCLSVDHVFDLAVRTTAIRQRQRDFEAVARRHETRRIGLRNQLWRDLFLKLLRTRGARRAGHDRDTDLTDELGKIERDAALAVRHRHTRLITTERLEPTRRDGTDTSQQLFACATAGLDSADLQHVLAEHRQDASVKVVKTVHPAAGTRQPFRRTRQRLSRQEIDAFVHDRDRRLASPRRHEVDDQLRALAIGAAAGDFRGNRDGDLTLDRTDGDRRVTMRTDRQTFRVRLDALDDRKMDLHVRGPVLFDRPQNDFARRIGQRQDLLIDETVARHRQERRARERTLHDESRRLTDAIKRLVRRDRDDGGIGHRRTDGLIAPIAEIELTTERDLRLGIRHRHDVVAALLNRQGERRIAVRPRADRHLVDDRNPHAITVPGGPAAAVALVAVAAVDARNLDLQPLRLGEALAVRHHTGKLDFRETGRRTPQPAVESRADVIGIVVGDDALASRRGTSAVLEDGPLGSHLDRGPRQTGVRPDRRDKATGALVIQPHLRQTAEIGLERTLGIAEQEALPSLRLERRVLEHHGAVAAKCLGRSAVEVLGEEIEGEFLRPQILGCLHLHTNLRRREFLDLDITPTKTDGLLAWRTHDKMPRSAHLVRRDREGIVRENAIRIHHHRLLVRDAVKRILQLNRNRERLRRHALAVAEDRLEEDLLVMAIDAAIRPHKRLTFVLGEIIGAVRRGFLLIDDIGQREERHVGSVRTPEDHGKRLALVDARGAAPALRIRHALRHQHIRLRIELDLCTGNRLAFRQGGHPHAQIRPDTPNTQPEVRHTDDS